MGFTRINKLILINVSCLNLKLEAHTYVKPIRKRRLVLECGIGLGVTRINKLIFINVSCLNLKLEAQTCQTNKEKTDWYCHIDSFSNHYVSKWFVMYATFPSKTLIGSLYWLHTLHCHESFRLNDSLKYVHLLSASIY